MTPEIYGEETKDRIQSLIRVCAAGQQVIIVCDNTGQQSRMDEILTSQREEMKEGRWGYAFPQTSDRRSAPGIFYPGAEPASLHGPGDLWAL